MEQRYATPLEAESAALAANAVAGANPVYWAAEDGDGEYRLMKFRVIEWDASGVRLRLLGDDEE